jgi:hypothetical protein
MNGLARQLPQLGKPMARGGFHLCNFVHRGTHGPRAASKSPKELRGSVCPLFRPSPFLVTAARLRSGGVPGFRLVGAALCNFVHGLSPGTRDVVRRFPGVEEASPPPCAFLCNFVNGRPGNRVAERARHPRRFPTGPSVIRQIQRWLEGAILPVFPLVAILTPPPGYNDVEMVFAGSP